MSQADFETPTMDDFEIRQRVESIAGKNARVVDCEKKSSFVSEETLLINGVPVKLEGKAGERIKEALKNGQPPPVELLSEILVQAGIQKSPVQLETTMTVKSSTKTSELSTLRDGKGKLVDEKLKEFEEDDEIQTASVEIWEKESEEAQKLRKSFEQFRSNVEPFIIPKPLPRTHTPDRTPPKTLSPQSATFRNNNNNGNGYQSHNHNQFSSPNYVNINNNNISNNNSPSMRKPPPPPPPASPKQRPSDPPPRIPSLMTPLKINMNGNSNKPIPPPKPNKAKYQEMINSSTFTTSSSSESLRREKNFELPVRVVYETFI